MLHTGIRATPREKKSGAPKPRELASTWQQVREQILGLLRADGIPRNAMGKLDSLVSRDLGESPPSVFLEGVVADLSRVQGCFEVIGLPAAALGQHAGLG